VQRAGRNPTVVVEIPGANVGKIGGIRRAIRRFRERQVLLDRLLANSAQNVDTKFQAERVNVIRKRLKPAPFAEELSAGTW
jgi:hypothetical protein